MNKKTMLRVMLLTTGMLATGMHATAAKLQEDQIAFSKSKRDVNIRTRAGKDGEVVAKLGNKNAVTVLKVIDDDWCFVSSGNAVGYVKSKYLTTGKETDQIAEEVGYKVAVVYPKALNVRSRADCESSVIDVASGNQELEVVSYDGGAWMKVAMEPDSIGYIDASLCACKTYYPVAKVVNEEAAARVEIPAFEEPIPQEIPAVLEDTVAYEEPAAEETWEEENGADYSGEIKEWTEENWSDGSDEGWTEENWSDGSDEDWTEENWSDGSDESWMEENWSDRSDEGWTEENWSDGSDESWTEENWSDGSDESWADDSDYGNDWTVEEESYDYDSGVGSWDEPEVIYDNETVYAEDDSQDGSDYDYGYEEAEDASVDTSAGQAIADFAMQFVGNPYVYGGTSLTGGTDCSGFTQSVMSNFGISINRTAADQSYGGQSVAISDIQPGDLLFYSNGGGISHVAIYIGGGQIVHAANESQGIIVSSYDYNSPVCAARYW